MAELLTHLDSALSNVSVTRQGRPSVATAYLKRQGLDAFIAGVGEEAIRGSRWMLDLNPEFIAAGSTDIGAVRRLLDLGADVRSLGRLHAKLYLLPTDNSLILGSANLTGGGLNGNHEIVLLTEDTEITTRANEIFEEWWRRGETIYPERCDELQMEADEIRARETGVRRLTELGAFVTITTSTPDERQQLSLRWEDVGVPPPGDNEIRPTPPILPLWPAEVNRAFLRESETCRRWLKRNAVKVNKREFLPRPLFPDLRDRVAAANGRMSDALEAIRGEKWLRHRESLEALLHTWLHAVAEDQRRGPQWVKENVQSIMDKVRPIEGLGSGFRVGYDLDIPHPDVDGFSELVRRVSAKVATHPAFTQKRLPMTGGEDR